MMTPVYTQMATGREEEREVDRIAVVKLSIFIQMARGI
jgi:hypothetical protein